jgi:thiol-disulfide isomerase/thioredoxin
MGNNRNGFWVLRFLESMTRRFRISGALTALFALTAFSCSKGTTPPEGTPLPSGGDDAVVELLKEPTPVQEFTLTDLDGRSISSADLRGKVVMVNFWATWCPPCRAEIPDLIKLQDKYRDKLVVIGISEDEIPTDEVKAFAVAQKMNYPIAMTNPQLAKIFRGVSALPTTFVIDREGKLQQRHVGMLNKETTELEAQVLLGLNQNARVERVDDPARVRLENAAQATSIPGVDLAGLTPAKRTEAIKALNADDCTCGCGLTLAECRINDPTCSVSLPLAQKMVEKIAATAPAH